MEPTAKTYEVVGALRVLDTDPGDQFTASLPPEQECLLIEGGHIRVVLATGGIVLGDTGDDGDGDDDTDDEQAGDAGDDDTDDVEQDQTA